MYKIIGMDQKEYGPVTSDQLKQWITQGRINAQSKVQADGGLWRPLSDFPEFAEALASRPSMPSSAHPPLPTYSGAAKTSGLAIASLICGIVSLPTCGLAGVAGVIMGVIAINQIRKSNGALKGNGLALAGTIISILFLLMLPVALLLPALAKAKQRAQTIQCLNNMRQLALGARMYSQEHQNHFPPAATWCDALKTEVGSDKVFLCPTAHPEDRCDYAYNSQLDGMDVKDINPRTVLFFEADPGWNISGGAEQMRMPSRHGRTYVVVFADGHVEQLTSARLADLRWNP
jgi:prepilin-type processing-associated H-X9-DG protein